MILAACRESNSQVDQAAGFKNIMKRMGGNKLEYRDSKTKNEPVKVFL